MVMNYREREGVKEGGWGAGFIPTKRGVGGTLFSHPERGGGTQNVLG